MPSLTKNILTWLWWKKSLGILHNDALQYCYVLQTNPRLSIDASHLYIRILLVITYESSWGFCLLFVLNDDLWMAYNYYMYCLKSILYSKSSLLSYVTQNFITSWSFKMDLPYFKIQGLQYFTKRNPWILYEGENKMTNQNWSKNDFISYWIKSQKEEHEFLGLFLI